MHVVTIDDERETEFSVTRTFSRDTLSGTSVWRPQSRYTVSRIECRIKFLQNQRCRAKIHRHDTRSHESELSQAPHRLPTS